MREPRNSPPPRGNAGERSPLKRELSSKLIQIGQKVPPLTKPFHFEVLKRRPRGIFCMPRLLASSSLCYTLSVMSMFLVSTMSTAKTASLFGQNPPRIISRKRFWGGPALLFFYFFCAHLFFFWCNWPSEWVRNMRGDEVVAFCFYSVPLGPTGTQCFPVHSRALIIPQITKGFQ